MKTLLEAAREALIAMDGMLRNGEWYQGQERADALRAAIQAAPVDTEEAIQTLARDLPAGYRVELTIEKDAGDVYLTDPKGNLSSVHSDGDTVGEKLLDALRCAQEDAAP